MLVAAAAVAALAAVLALFLGTLVLVLGRLPEADEQDLLPSALVAAAVAALAFGPVRAALTAATRRTAIGGRRTPESVLEAFGDRAAREIPVEELLRQLAEALRDAYGLAAVEVWTRDGADLVRLLSLPHRAAPLTRLGATECEALRRSGVAGESWLRLWVPALLEGRGDAQVRVAPAGHGNELLALLLAERPRGAERFRAAEERALGEVVRRLGVVLHNRALDAALQTTLDDLRRTNDELRASRSRLVSAADGERRRIERDIHDGAQQHLAALAINLGLARQLLGDGTVPPDDVPTVAALLEEMQDDVRETIAQVRDLAHGIYPPLLRQAGLPDALAAAAQRSPNAVTLEIVDVTGRQEADVEAAAVLLLPGGAAEHREARTRRHGHRAAAGRRRCPGARGRGRRPRLRRRQRRRRPGSAEHDRPARCGRRCAHGRHRPRSRHPGAGRGAARGAGVTTTGGGTPWGAMRVVAGAELRTRWRSLVVVGLLAGLVAAVVGASTAVARRTATAYERLAAATHLDDARVLIFSDAVTPEEVESLPGVESSWRSRQVIGQVVGGPVTFLSVSSGQPQPDDLFTPVVIEGRAPDRRPGRRGAGPRGAGEGGRDRHRRPHPAQAAHAAGGHPVRHRLRRAGRARADAEGRRHRAGRARLGGQRRRADHGFAGTGSRVRGQHDRPQRLAAADGRGSRFRRLRPRAGPAAGPGRDRRHRSRVRCPAGALPDHRRRPGGARRAAHAGDRTDRVPRDRRGRRAARGRPGPEPAPRRRRRRPGAGGRPRADPGRAGARPDGSGPARSLDRRRSRRGRGPARRTGGAAGAAGRVRAGAGLAAGRRGRGRRAPPSRRWRSCCSRQRPRPGSCAPRAALRC